MSDSPAPAASAPATAAAPAPVSAASASPALSAVLHGRSPALAPIKALAPLRPSNDTSAAAADTAASSAPPQLSLADGASDGDDTAAAAAPAPHHELHQRWVFWHDVSDGKPKEWGASLVKLYEFNTVENFWSVVHTAREASGRYGERKRL